MFSPTLGRWTQNDPIEYDAGDPHLYRFVSNNPTNLTDPSGLVGLIGSVVAAALTPLTGPLFRYEQGDGELPSLSDKTRFNPAPYNYLGVLYGVEPNGFRSAGAGYFQLKSTGKEATKATFKSQSIGLGPINFGGFVKCEAKITFDVDVTIKFGRMFSEKPAGSGKFPFGAGGGFVLLTLVQKQYKNVNVHVGGAATSLGDFWERVGVITPREAVYISSDPARSTPGPRFGHKAIDADKALRKYTINDKAENAGAELKKLYRFLTSLN